MKLALMVSETLLKKFNLTQNFISKIASKIINPVLKKDLYFEPIEFE